MMVIVWQLFSHVQQVGFLISTGLQSGVGGFASRFFQPFQRFFYMIEQLQAIISD
jgi:hypothetical protein